MEPAAAESIDATTPTTDKMSNLKIEGGNEKQLKSGQSSSKSGKKEFFLLKTAKVRENLLLNWENSDF